MTTLWILDEILTPGDSIWYRFPNNHPVIYHVLSVEPRAAFVKYYEQPYWRHGVLTAEFILANREYLELRQKGGKL